MKTPKMTYTARSFAGAIEYRTRGRSPIRRSSRTPGGDSDGESGLSAPPAVTLSTQKGT